MKLVVVDLNAVVVRVSELENPRKGLKQFYEEKQNMATSGLRTRKPEEGIETVILTTSDARSKLCLRTRKPEEGIETDTTPKPKRHGLSLRTRKPEEGIETVCSLL